MHNNAGFKLRFLRELVGHELRSLLCLFNGNKAMMSQNYPPKIWYLLPLVHLSALRHSFHTTGNLPSLLANCNYFIAFTPFLSILLNDS